MNTRFALLFFGFDNSFRLSHNELIYGGSCGKVTLEGKIFLPLFVAYGAEILLLAIIEILPKSWRPVLERFQGIYLYVLLSYSAILGVGFFIFMFLVLPITAFIKWIAG
ncbi:hypothetical protein [Acidisphaera sp. S103]|uniref:hypothetical protein n=1 Tax=Acidisphaera sp. S103 TaxID=1747223 RepID=UPI00131B61DD|nr:hypothetical protein [Acidisphaera sp. S103]